MNVRPTPEELALAGEIGATVPDIISEDLDVLFCGINPGLWSGAVGHHFARPGNRFWTVLALSGFVPEVFAPADERCLVDYGLGITNLVARSTAVASSLPAAELRSGAPVLEHKVARFRPRFVAVLGMGAYRVAFCHSKAPLGEQASGIGGARVWVLPNPSGAQARYQLPELVLLFGELREAVGGGPSRQDSS